MLTLVALMGVGRVQSQNKFPKEERNCIIRMIPGSVLDNR